MDVGATSSASYGAHAVLDDTLHEDRKQKLQSVAGTDVTDQISATVHGSAMEGGDPNPGAIRDGVTGYNTPASFVPKYGVSTTKDAGDLAKEENTKNVEINKKAEAKKARDAAAL
jgi:hypothetical protein